MRARLFQRRGLLAEMNHVRGQLDRKLGQVLGPGVLQRLRRFHDLERVADRVAQRLVHVGDQRADPLIHAPPDRHHHLRQPARIHLLLHERAVAHLHVEHQRIHALRQLLRHDRRRDQRNRFHRARDIAQRVQLPVRGRELVGLADEGEPDARQAASRNSSTVRFVRKPGIDSSLSSVPPVWPSARPDIIGTTTPAAAASGATMKLVLSPTPPVECLSTFTPGIADRSTVSPERSMHSVKAADFAVGHPREEHGHQERRHLVIRNVAAGVAFHQKLDLFGSELFAVALALDQVNCTHFETLSLSS